jgi:lysophospholipase L1-like esterase
VVEKSFPPEGGHRGFGGSHSPRAPTPLHASCYPKPGAIVLYAGDNDIASGKKPEQVHEDFRAFVKVVREKMPATPIYFLSIKPSIKRWMRIEAIRKANALVEAECKEGKGLIYVDVATPMLGKDGKPRAELFVKDGLHLSAEGYALWTKVLREHLETRER